MKHYELQSTATHYVVEIEQELLTQEPALLEQAGEPIAVVLPISEYKAFRTWQTTPASAIVASESHSSPEFAEEVAAFERMKPQLLKQHPGKVVAIYQGKVVAVGDKRLEVLDQVWDKFGEVTCYIENVLPETPRRARIPSAWIRK